MNLPRILLSSFCLLCLQACKQASESVTEDQDTAGSRSTRSRSSQTEQHQQSASSLKKAASDFSIVSLEEKLAKMHPEDLLSYREQIRELLMAHPDQAHAILAYYSELLFKNSPAEAITFTMAQSYLLPQNAGDQISAQLLKTWQQADTSALQGYLHTLAKHHGGTEQECHHALQLLIKSEEGTFESSTWLTWLDALSKGEGEKGELQGAALNTMLTLVDPSDSTQLTPLVEAYQTRLDDVGMQKHLPNFADIIAKHRPTESQHLLEKMPGGSYRDLVLERTIAELGRSHPEVGAEWLSSQDILEKIFRPEFDTWAENAQKQGVDSTTMKNAQEAFEQHVDQVFDRTLETYILNLVHQHPEDAMRNVDSLIDPVRKENLRQRIQAILDTF